jgi:hypothetical protein
MQSPASPDEQQKLKELEQSQRVMLLLEDLIDRERHTLDAIMQALFEIGSVNFVNQKVRTRFLRPVIRPAVKVSKPVLTYVGYRWFRKKGPRLIVNWLFRKIRFAPSSAPTKLPTPAPLANAVLYQGEIRRLRSQVRWMTGALVSVSGVLVAFLNGFDPRILLNSTANNSTINSPGQQNQVADSSKPVAQPSPHGHRDTTITTEIQAEYHPKQN